MKSHRPRLIAARWMLVLLMAVGIANLNARPAAAVDKVSQESRANIDSILADVPEQVGTSVPAYATFAGKVTEAVRRAWEIGDARAGYLAALEIERRVLAAPLYHRMRVAHALICAAGLASGAGEYKAWGRMAENAVDLVESLDETIPSEIIRGESQVLSSEVMGDWISIHDLSVCALTGLLGVPQCEFLLAGNPQDVWIQYLSEMRDELIWFRDWHGLALRSCAAALDLPEEVAAGFESVEVYEEPGSGWSRLGSTACDSMSQIRFYTLDASGPEVRVTAEGLGLLDEPVPFGGLHFSGRVAAMRVQFDDGLGPIVERTIEFDRADYTVVSFDSRKRSISCASWSSNHRGSNSRRVFYSDASQMPESNLFLPLLAQYVPAVYPADISEAGIEGIVYIDVNVNEYGRIVDWKLGEGSVQDVRLQQTALRAAKRTAFAPGAESDVVVPLWIRIPYGFYDTK